MEGHMSSIHPVESARPTASGGARPRRIVAALAGVAALTVAMLAAGTARAGEPPTDPPCQARPVPGYLRGDLTTAEGRPSGQFSDTRCPGRTLRASLEAGFHYILNSGFVEPNATYVAAYTPSNADQPVHEDVATAGDKGELKFPVTDVSRFMKPGDRVTVRVLPVGLGLRPTAVEYAVMLAL
jgi:hypothetical protein